MSETPQQQARRNLDNHIWREKRRLIDQLRFTWETMGPETEFEHLIYRMNLKKDELFGNGGGIHERYEDPVEGKTRQYTQALLELSKEFD